MSLVNAFSDYRRLTSIHEHLPAKIFFKLLISVFPRIALPLFSISFIVFSEMSIPYFLYRLLQSLWYLQPVLLATFTINSSRTCPVFRGLRRGLQLRYQEALSYPSSQPSFWRVQFPVVHDIKFQIRVSPPPQQKVWHPAPGCSFLQNYQNSPERFHPFLLDRLIILSK